MTDKYKFFIGILCVVICQVLFGFAFIFIKRVTATVSVMTLLCWRFVFAFILMSICILFRIIKVNYKGKSILPLFLLSIFHPVVYFFSEAVGINLTTVSESSTIIACIPIATIILSILILKELPARLQVTGVGMTVAGIVFNIIMQGFEVTFSPLGYTMLLFAVCSYALYSIFSQKITEFTSSEKSYAMITTGALIFTFIALIQNRNAIVEFLTLPFSDYNFLIAVLYLSTGCSIAVFILYNKAIEIIGASRAVSFSGISIIVAVISGVFILKENISVYQLISAALILGGVYLANVIPLQHRRQRSVC